MYTTKWYMRVKNRAVMACWLSEIVFSPLLKLVMVLGLLGGSEGEYRKAIEIQSSDLLLKIGLPITCLHCPPLQV